MISQWTGTADRSLPTCCIVSARSRASRRIPVHQSASQGHSRRHARTSSGDSARCASVSICQCRAGSRSILRAMQRRYTPERFFEKLRLAEAMIPGLVTSTTSSWASPERPRRTSRPPSTRVQDAIRRRLSCSSTRPSWHPGSQHAQITRSRRRSRAFRPALSASAADLGGEEPGAHRLDR